MRNILRRAAESTNRRSPVRANRGCTGLLPGHTGLPLRRNPVLPSAPYIVVSSSRSGLRNVEDGIHDKFVSARS